MFIAKKMLLNWILWPIASFYTKNWNSSVLFVSLEFLCNSTEFHVKLYLEHLLIKMSYQELLLLLLNDLTTTKLFMFYDKNSVEPLFLWY